MHRMRDLFARAGLTLGVVSVLVLGQAPDARAGLIQPNAPQAFPDLGADLVGTQAYTYNPATQTGTFVVNNAPSLLATGPRQANEYFVNDLPGQARSETIQVKLDSSGNLVSDPGNSFSVYGSVTIDGKSYSGLLLQGTPTAFGWAANSAQTPTMSVFDVNVNVTGGLLQQAYGNEAYIRVTSELGSSFADSFAQSFVSSQTQTNVRPFGLSPSPVPEPSTFAILLACSGAGLLYHQRRRIGIADLTIEE